ncbi:hypothetical protein [Pseudomonas sp. NPDC089569]|uniref:hypothetical protein n=1 Tax=Pseudomonas sp. NPDC089569 TaxID=3390722 RepID=UPI003D00CC9C
MASPKQQVIAQQFVDDMNRTRGIEFARLGMQVEVDGKMGTIVGLNASANLNVQMANQLKYGKTARSFHPTWKVKYFDEDGKVIAHFDENKCVFRPGQPAS